MPGDVGLPRDPMQRSAMAYEKFQAFKAAQDKKAPDDTKYPAPVDLKEDPRSQRYSLEAMGCSTTTHKSFQYLQSYPFNRKRLHQVHALGALDQYMRPGQGYPTFEPPPGHKIFSTAPPAAQQVPYLSLSYTPSRSDGK